MGQDPDVRYTQSNVPVATLSIATSQKYTDKNGQEQESTEWHRVVAWNRTAEVAQQYVKKGDLIYIEGPLETQKYEDNDGVTRYTTQIKALRMIMLGGKSGGDSRPHPAQFNKPESEGAPMSSAVDLDSADDINDDLPF